MIALDHPGMVLLALMCLFGRVLFANLSVGPVDTSMKAVLTPTLCLTIMQVGVHTVRQDHVESFQQNCGPALRSLWQLHALHPLISSLPALVSIYLA